MSSTELSLIIRKNYVYLIDTLVVTLYINVLYEREVLSIEEKDRLSKILDRREQAQCFVDMLMLKPKESIQKFFDIVKDEKDKQPQIYERVFPDFLSTEQEQRDGPNESVARKAHEVAARLDTMGDAQWEELVTPHFPAIIDALRPSLLLDHLRATFLLTRTEYDQLQDETMTEKARSRKLVNTFLPTKEGSFTKFCEVLLAVEGQRHIVTDILKLPVCLAATHPVQVADNLPEQMSTTQSSSEGQILASTNAEPQKHVTYSTSDSMVTYQSSIVQQAAGKEEQGTFSSCSQEGTARGSIAKKRKQNLANCSSAKRGGAALYFKPEHLEWAKTLKTAISSTCAECIGIDKEDVMFVTAETAELESMVKRWKPIHPVYVDSRMILGVLIVNGVDPNDIHDTHQKLLEKLVVKHVTDYDPNLDASDCRIVQIIMHNSSFIVLQLSINLFVHRFCALSKQEVLRSLRESLREIFPEATGAVLRLGGLPPLQLFNDQANAQNSEHSSVFDAHEGKKPCFIFWFEVMYCTLIGQELTESQRSEETVETAKSCDHGWYSAYVLAEFTKCCLFWCRQ